MVLQSEVSAKQCGLTIMESMLTWEFIILCRRQTAEVRMLMPCPGTASAAEIRLHIIEHQCRQAEEMMTQAKLPLPGKKLRLNDGRLVLCERFVGTALLKMTTQRIGAMSYIMRSLMTNQPLRETTGCWLRQEAGFLEHLVQQYCGRTNVDKTV